MLMEINKKNFWTGELGHELVSCMMKLDSALDDMHKIDHCYSFTDVDLYNVKLEAYELVLKELYGIQFYFTRNDKYFGLISEDGEFWVVKVER